jgi:glycosyltransferase involved in cell wall biosynthesis
MVPDAAEFLQKGQIFITPLLSGGGMRLKVVEAMGAGKCILSTKIGAEGIAYEDGKHILIADSAKDWQKALLELLGNPSRQIEIGGQARKLAEERYSWEATTLQLEEFYLKEVLQ